MHRLSLLVLLALCACQSSYNSKFQNEEGSFPEPSVLLKNAHGASQAVAGVGRFQGEMTCTAFLWKPDGALPESKAWALTNGHCAMPYSARSSGYDVWVNRPASAGWNIKFHYFVDTPAAQKSIAVASIIYSSMKALDLAVLELNASWSELEREGLLPLPQASKAADPGRVIRTVGIPQGSIPADEQYLREARCIEEKTVSVVEWYWTWFDAHRNSCADIREGSSGSPVLNAEGEVYAVVNTTSATGISDSCYLGNPCELERHGAVMVANKNYASAIVSLQQCFSNQTLSFGSDCPLPSPATIAYRDAPVIPTLPVDRQGQPLLWKVKAEGALWKVGPVGEVDCRDDDGYRDEALPTGELPKDNGLYLLCLQKKAWDERFPTVVVLSVDTRAPTLKPELSLRSWGEGLSFEPIFQVPELSLYQVGFGPRDTTDCEKLKLTPYRRIPISIGKQDLPARICVQGADHAGNPGPIFAYDVSGEDALRNLPRQMRSESSGQKPKEHDVIRKQ
jgi:hypothetical protein